MVFSEILQYFSLNLTSDSYDKGLSDSLLIPLMEYLPPYETINEDFFFGKKDERIFRSEKCLNEAPPSKKLHGKIYARTSKNFELSLPGSSHVGNILSVDQIPSYYEDKVLNFEDATIPQASEVLQIETSERRDSYNIEGKSSNPYLKDKTEEDLKDKTFIQAIFEIKSRDGIQINSLSLLRGTKSIGYLQRILPERFINPGCLSFVGVKKCHEDSVQLIFPFIVPKIHRKVIQYQRLGYNGLTGLTGFISQWGANNLRIKVRLMIVNPSGAINQHLKDNDVYFCLQKDRNDDIILNNIFFAKHGDQTFRFELRKSQSKCSEYSVFCSKSDIEANYSNTRFCNEVLLNTSCS